MKGFSIFYFVALGLAFHLNLNAQEARPKQQLNDAYNDALQRLGQNRPDEAVVALKKILAADPTFWRVYDQIVQAYGRLKQIDRAQSYFEELRSTNPNNPYAYYGLGVVYQEKREYPPAIAHYKKCMEWKAEFAGVYVRLVEACRAAKRPEEAMAYLKDRIQSDPTNGFAPYGLAYLHFLQNSWLAALPPLERAVQLKPDLESAYRLKGLIYDNMGRSEEALKDYERALALAEQENDLESLAGVLNYLGAIYTRQGHYGQALEYLQKSLLINQQADNQQGEAHSYNNLGRLAWFEEDYGKALEYYQKSLTIRQQLEDRSGEAVTLHNLGLLYWNEGQYEKTFEYYQQSLRIQQQIEDRPGEGRTLLSLGTWYWSEGQYGKALECYQKGLMILQQLPDQQGEATALNNLAIFYQTQGDDGQALDYYQKSLALSQQLKDRRGEGNRLINIASVYTKQGHYEKALEYFQKSLTIRQQLQDRRGEGTVFNYMGDVYRGQRHYRRALECYEKSLSISRQVGYQWLESTALNSLGLTYTALGDHPRAVEYLRLALELAKEVNAPTRWSAHVRLARALESQRPPNMDEALAHYRSAAEITKDLRSQWQQPEHRIGFFEGKVWVYERLCNLLARMHRQPAGKGKGYDREAFHYVEESRARALVELLEESRASLPITEGLDADLRERERRLQDGLSEAQVRLKREKQSARIKELEKRRDALYYDYENLIGELRRRNPRYAQLKYPEAVTLEQCQPRLDDETVLLEYLLGEEDSLLFAVSKERYELFRLPGRRTIEESVKKLRPTWTAAGTVDPREQWRYVAEAQALYRHLIQPAEKVLQGKKRVLLAPDGVLYYLPFAALLTRAVSVAGPVDFQKLPYMVRRYEIRYIPSASVWSLLSEPKKERATGRKKFLAFADPAYEPSRTATGPVASRRGAAESIGPAADERGRGWSRLPYSGEEVRAIAALYPREAVQLFLREAATEENVKHAFLWEYQRIHFAAHSVADESRPQFSGIILTTQAGSGEDGYLHMYEIFNLRLAAQLVVLSGCETALGKQTKGEGMVGLVRAFLYAGAEHIAASLWKIEDRSTAELMRTFYQRLETSAPASALRSAQLDFIQGRRYSHPYFWAAFALYGGR